MKILFLSSRIPFPVKDGHSRRTYNILRGLAQRHEVYLLSLFQTPEEINPRTIRHLEGFCTKVEALPAPEKKVSGSMLIRLARSFVSRDPYTIWRHYSRDYLKSVQHVTRERQFDLVHCDILPVAYTIQELKSVPCVLTDHDVCYLKAARMARQNRNPLAKAFLYLESLKLKRFEGDIFERVDAGIAVSDVDRQILQQLAPTGRITVIENGVDTSEFVPAKIDTGNPSLLWVGGFGYAPNREAVHYFLDQIYPLIKENVPDVTITIIGSGLTARIERHAERDSSIKLLGYVNDPIPHIQESAVFIVPILSGSGTRLKTLEAMAAGKAVVTTAIGCEGIEGRDQLHFLVADSPANFAQSVTTLLRNPRMRKQLGENARELMIKKYDWQQILSRLDSFYTSMKLPSSQRVRTERSSPVYFKTFIKAITPKWLRQYVLKGYYLRHLKQYLENGKGEQQEADVRMIRRLVKEGDIAVDVGANFGFYTLVLSKLVGRTGHVYSIEPISLTFDILTNNIKKLNLFNVTSMNCAASESNGAALMEIPRYNSGGENYYQAKLVSQSDIDSRLQQFPVVLKTLDTLLGNHRDKVAFMKIDVEGHELNVIQGAMKIIEACRPMLLIEVSTTPDDLQSSAFTLFKQLKQKGYAPFFFDGHELKARNQGDHSVNYFFLTNDHLRTGGFVSAAAAPHTGAVDRTKETVYGVAP